MNLSLLLNLYYAKNVYVLYATDSPKKNCEFQFSCCFALHTKLCNGYKSARGLIWTSRIEWLVDGKLANIPYVHHAFLLKQNRRSPTIDHQLYMW